ncbi:MAG TPA: aminoacyl--tRNA ligase-related protein [Candidatus Saccharimonadales bacterium]|nr:aminoacyl--tRNA ligase-related protein [Candidatus Saccharimonadales bacterium]
MKMTQLFTKTSKTVPADESARNAQLLIQAGYIHKEMAGVYAFLPLGKRVLDNIANIVREEMNAVGGQEVQMTVLQPKDIFELTDRWDDEKVDNWFKTSLKNGTELGMGLTHEEPIVDSLKPFISSYKDLPVSVYQIQNKFRNELRAKSGLLRGREFVMKDMYSFARNEEEHLRIYEEIAEAYGRVYARLGIGDITYRTYADGGIFTKKFSDEFQTLSPIGEDTIYVHEGKKIAFNEEIMSDETLANMGVKREELVEKKGVEVGNIFPLESKYSDALGLFYSDEDGNDQSVVMGCYGIGVSRLVGMLAEHFSDDKGLVWPENVAPFKVIISQLGTDEAVTKAAYDMYQKLTEAGVAVLYDNRTDARPGEKFADADLLGIPYRVVVSAKTVAADKYEVKKRVSDQSELCSLDDVIKLTSSKQG